MTVKAQSKNKYCFRKTMNFDYNDDDSTVSYYDSSSEFLIEMNPVLMQESERRHSFAQQNTTDDDSTVSTVPSTNGDDDCCSIDSDDFNQEYPSAKIYANLYRQCDDLNNATHDLLPQNASILQIKPLVRKRVTFGLVSIREYGITVGAPTTKNAWKCPMELTWEHTASDIITTVDDMYIQQRFQRHLVPCPLSISERRDRIAKVQGISIDDVSTLEYIASMDLIQETIQSVENKRRNILSNIMTPIHAHNDTITHQSIYLRKKKTLGESNGMLRTMLLKEIPQLTL